MEEVTGLKVSIIHDTEDVEQILLRIITIISSNFSKALPSTLGL